MTAKRIFSFFTLILFTFIVACSEPTEEKDAGPVDIFSYSNFSDVVVKHINLDLEVMFEEKMLEGSAELTIEKINADANTLVLDSRDLNIFAVEAFAEDLWQETTYRIGARDDVLGQPMTIDLIDGTEKVRIFYSSNPGASGLQWLAPIQTASGEYPFMFSQSQAIHARSWVPLQDSPAVRFTYTAHVKTPDTLIAIMSAAQDPDGVLDGDYTFDMPQPIPSYLMAIAVGDLEFREISDNIGVYAESYIVDAAAKEFEDTPAMVVANEAFYGPYLWGRFDMLVLPPSFPFGGMENPRLTFLTPTLIAGDKSLTNVVAHELAHSWSGNQVTNATWREPWLNEGITSYVETRIMEEVFGLDRANMELILSKADWLADDADMKAEGLTALTALKLPADFEDPDMGFSSVAYVKGQFFMIFLEETFGRERFDPFLKGYFDHFAFQSITTEDFVAYMEKNLFDKYPGVVDETVVHAWLYEPGVPATTSNPTSEVFAVIDTKREAWVAGEVDIEGLGSDAWTTHEWLHFINGLPDELAMEKFQDLDRAFELSVAGNVEIAFAWYMKSLEADYPGVVEPLRKFLIRVGRGKFIYPLYAKLVEVHQADWARGVYAEARPGYHPIAQRRIDAIFAEAE